MNTDTLKAVLAEAREVRRSWGCEVGSPNLASHIAGLNWETRMHGLRDTPAEGVVPYASACLEVRRRIGGAGTTCSYGAYYPYEDRIEIADDLTGYAEAQVLAHELCHASGHPKRLNRPVPRALATRGMFGLFQVSSRQQAVEELVAELGSLLILEAHGHAVDVSTSALYCAANMVRIARLHDGPTIRMAEAAADYVLNWNQREEERS